MLHKAWNSKEEMPYCFPRSSIKFQGHTGQNITDFDPNWAFPDYRPVAAFKSLRFALFFQKWDFKFSYFPEVFPQLYAKVFSWVGDAYQKRILYLNMMEIFIQARC